MSTPLFSPDEKFLSKQREPITKAQLHAYAQASGDHNRIHLDDEVARKAGLSGVIAHGMLSMAFMGEYVADLVRDQGRIVEFTCRFKAMTYPGDVVTISGSVKSREAQRIMLVVDARNQRGEITAMGALQVELL